MSISNGVILQYICKGELPPSSKCTFQVMGTRKIPIPEREKSSQNMVKYRICLSDGDHRYSQAVMMLENESMVPNDLTLIHVDPEHSKNSLKNISGKLILVIGDFTVVKHLDARIGNPVTIPPEAWDFQEHSNGTNLAGPSTPQQGTSNGASREPPPLPHKRPLDRSPPGNGTEDNKAKQARRNLFPEKTTHEIKDLNPYQNKYTIKARVIKKSQKKTWSNSRGEGCVFDFILKDASGEIKVTGFNDEANKYFDTIQEGKIYYLSNGKIQNVRKPEYNNTGHNYELTLMQHTQIEQTLDRNNAVPTVDYNFVKVADIQNVNDKDKIDILVLVTKVGTCVTQALRSGRDTKKREVTVTDDSNAEIMLTLWGDNAAKYDQENFEGKVIAIRSVQVSDWNGKSLSCTFGSTLDIDPDIPEAEILKNLQQTGQVQTLTTDRLKPKIDGGFTCLKEIQTECQDSAVQVNFYNLCAYLTELKADKIMYKACPSEKCNKQVTDMANGKWRCEKCREEFPEFQWRYIVRGAIADATNYQWITLFDDSAKKIIGKSAKEMASIKESNEIEFRRILHRARYRQFNFSVKTSKETWNDEDRLKMTVTNVEPIDAQTRTKHMERLKAEIEALQIWT